MKRQQIIIQNQFGLHTRAAVKLVETARQFASRIELNYCNHVVDCKSIMGVITLGAQKDSMVDILAEGEDETQAVNSILELVNNRFGEQ